MAERRMFSKTIIDSDVFLDMPLSTQALYFHLAMRADDDGFINNPKKIMRMVGAAQNELELLLAKRYVLGFESGVVVVKHWKIHNYIQKDRYKETVYIEEKNLITVKGNKSYTELDTLCIQDGDTGKVRLGKESLGKVSKEPIFDSEIDSFAGNHGAIIDDLIADWNSKGLPNCRYSSLNVPNLSDIIEKLSVFTPDEIKVAFSYLKKHWEKIDKQFRPSSFHRFIPNSLDRWTEDADPDSRYADPAEEKKKRKEKADGQKAREIEAEKARILKEREKAPPPPNVMDAILKGKRADARTE